MDIQNLSGAVLLSIESDTPEGVDFYKKDLERANLDDMNCIRSRFYGANLKGASFKRAQLKRADFQVANLEGADLRWSNLTYANLLGTNLCGADLTEANLEWVVFKGTKYDKHTKFPKGFNPQDHEMVLAMAASTRN